MERLYFKVGWGEEMSGGLMRSHDKCKKSKKYNPNVEICVVCGWMQNVQKNKLFNMTNETCANCGHKKWKHAFLRDKFQFCKECDCKKFIPKEAQVPQNHSLANRIMSSDRTGSSLNSDKHQNNPPKTGLRAENSGAERDSDRPKPQNHSHPENTSDLVEASKCSEDTEPLEKSGGSL